MSLLQANVAWNVAGTHAINVEYLGAYFPEVLILTQSGTSITGGSLDTIPSGSYFVVTGGSVIGNAINIDCNKNGLIVHLTGTIANDGTMSGTWADTSGGTRTGTWFIGTLIPAPEYMFGALAALGACFAGFVAFKKRSSLPHLRFK